MRSRTRNRYTPSVAAMMLAVGMMFSQPAAAQLFFDWGGQEKPNDSGRLVGQFDPSVKAGEIIVSFTDRRLYLVTQPGTAISYPIAIPREQDRWEGKTTVTQKRENPSWTPTPDMIKENPRLPRWVPGGHPMNPLGVRALYLGSSFYRIHGTDAPWTIGTAVSKGCIRMYNKDSQDIYERVKVGAKVLVTWNAYKFTASPAQPVEAVAAAQGPVQAPLLAPMQSTEPTPRAATAARGTDRPTETPARRTKARADVQLDTEAAPFAGSDRAEQEPREAPAARSNRRDVNAVRASGTEKGAAAPSDARPKSSRVETGAIGERRSQTSSRVDPAKVPAKAKDAVTGEEPVQIKVQDAAPVSTVSKVQEETTTTKIKGSMKLFLI